MSRQKGRINRMLRTGVAPKGATLCHTTGKWSWKTMEEAVAVMEKTQATPEIANPPRRAYHCVWCDGHHLTNRATHPLDQEDDR